jgi:hypothetical protein
MKKNWVVRVCLFRKPGGRDTEFQGTGLDVWITEHLRYMDLVKVVRNADDLIFDIFPPTSEKADGGKDWAERNAKRLQSFTCNAVAAPRV